MERTWSIISLAAESLNHAIGLLHETIAHHVTGEPFVASILTTLAASSLLSLIITSLSLGGYVMCFVPAWRSITRWRERAIAADYSAATSAASAAPAATELPGRGTILARCARCASRAWLYCRDRCGFCAGLISARHTRVVKVRLHGEAMWHRMLHDNSRVNTLAALRSAVQVTLAAAADNEEGGALEGLLAAEIRAAKVSRIVLLPDIILGDGDVAALRAAAELEVFLKL